LKKIDLHVHTVSTFSDPAFTFSLDSFRRYVSELSLDAVAVTNHDVFDHKQYLDIQAALDIVVFPGIEINVEKGHLLLIAAPSSLDKFASSCEWVQEQIRKIGDTLSVDALLSCFNCLDEYLVIPHYDKNPPIRGEVLERLRTHIFAGEVDSAKKFVRLHKEESELTPVLFSDARMKANLDRLPNRQTYVSCGELTIPALKSCLRDRRKVALSSSDGNRLWQVLDNGLKISTGLNVVLGARSSGKTHTLNEIYAAIEESDKGQAKYVRQFSLVQQSDESNERQFRNEVERRRSIVVDDYLAGFKRTLEDIIKVDLRADDAQVEKFVTTLLKSAEDVDRRDAFSKATLFNEESFPKTTDKTLQELIESVRQVIGNREFRSVIERHVNLSALRSLAIELIELLHARTLERAKKGEVNALVQDIKKGLNIRTSATQIESVDLYACAMNRRRVARFCEMVESLRRDRVIFKEQLQGYRVEARIGEYEGPGELKTASGKRATFSDAFKDYNSPYQYLQRLLEKDELAESELYKLFAKISYRVLNADGYEISGGERSEYRLLQEIADSKDYEVVLIDEPESSFDNLFLCTNVNRLLRDVAQRMPVIVVTHNSTVGASVGADYILHTRKEIGPDRKVHYRVYAGYPTDRVLTTLDGNRASSHEILMNTLEAGAEAYEGRKKTYEAIKN
jgi:alpha-D-ribose 1-methylphosphonate 5-triphosphate synthase subunit PhnL